MRARPERDIARPSPEDESTLIRQTHDDVAEFGLPGIGVVIAEEIAGPGLTHRIGASWRNRSYVAPNCGQGGGLCTEIIAGAVIQDDLEEIALPRWRSRW